MATAVIQSAYVAGEMSPSLFGRVDLQKYHVGASTMRNMFASYRGGASSRAGTAFVGQSKTSGSSLPPRLITFSFSINQAYALEFGDQYMRVISDGAYVLSASSARTITSITQANPGVVSTSTSHGFVTGDDVYIAGAGGMVQVDNQIFRVGTTTSDTFQLKDMDGGNINTTTYTTYTSGGTVTKLFTLTTPYAIADVLNLKYAQSADVMSICHPSYAPRDLTRLAADNWTLTTTTFATVMTAPSSASATASNTTGSSATQYQYVVTSVSSTSKQESIASNIATVSNSVDIAVVAGTITLNWSSVSGAGSYNVYKATPAYNTTIPAGVLFGYAGTAYSTSFIDTNIVQDFNVVPPLHSDPFSTSDNYPSCVAYFQQRRVYANTNNNPDTYQMSQPGAYTNMDSRIPTIDSDAIIGTPWAQQVNGIQALVPMPGGLVVLTGLGAWQVSGGDNFAPITPSSQTAVPQAYNGCHDNIPPITINYDILYVQAKGSIVRDLAYNYFINIYTGTDLTVLSNHLFYNHSLVAWAWSEEPYKLIWAVRDDGILLCLTFLKEQDVYAWSRHDTQGLFQCVTSVSEPPVDATYFVVKRRIGTTWRYYIERMDNRLWQTVEQCWCVDSGLQYPMTSPDATLTAASASGSQEIGSVIVIDGGSGYVSPTITITDESGTGAAFSATVSGGVITSVAVTSGGSEYTHPVLTVHDTSGSRAVLQAVVTNDVLFTASTASFTSGDVGNVLRMGGGKAIITAYSSSTIVTANITEPITQLIPDDENNVPVPFVSGTWTISTPTDVIYGLRHLEGKHVSILADGSAVMDQTVTDGTVRLPASASEIVVGLPFTAQLQTMPLDVPGGPTIQGKRKSISAVTLKVDASRGASVGSNQPDASTQPNGANVPWTNMVEVKERNNSVYAGMSVPLFTGDVRVIIPPAWAKPGQVAIQQTYPLPLNILASIPEIEVGDTNG